MILTHVNTTPKYSDGVQYTDNNGYISFKPAGVCIENQYSVGSTMIVCDPADTTTIFQATWDTATDCSGEPAVTDTWVGIKEYNDTTVSCCSGSHSTAKQCQYALRAQSTGYVCVPEESYTYVVGTCSRNMDDYPYKPSFYTSIMHVSSAVRHVRVYSPHP